MTEHLSSNATQGPTTPPKPPSRKVHVETWGCQMNVADSERMLSLLKAQNYELAPSADEADLVLLNTCHIREKARHKVLSRLGVLKELKGARPGMTIAVAGCVAQADGIRLLKDAPQIDVLFGPGKIDDLPQLLKDHEASGTSAVSLGFKKGRADEPETLSDATSMPALTATTPTLSGKNEVSRYVNIQQGCNNFCTFCVVPFTRGREISRMPTEILDECQRLIDGGAKELTLLGQNVNSYGLDLIEGKLLDKTPAGPFADLLRVTARLPGLERLRFTTSNPHDFGQPVAQLFKEEPRMGRYIHLPVQSGNDELLSRMRRKVTVAEYWERIHWLRTAIPDMAISTDLIVGFPGETDAQFEDTLALVEQVRYSFIFSFKYSPRRNTAAARFKDQVADDVKDLRLARLNALQDRITLEENLREIQTSRDVLFLYESRKAPGFYYGRTEHFRLVRVEASHDVVGKLLPVRIEGANKTALVGSII